MSGCGGLRYLLRLLHHANLPNWEDCKHRGGSMDVSHFSSVQLDETIGIDQKGDLKIQGNDVVRIRS